MQISKAEWRTLQGDRTFCDDLRLYYRRARLNVEATQPVFSEKTGLHIKSIQRIEQGHLAKISLDRAQKLSSAIGQTLEEMCASARQGILPLPAPKVELPHLRFLEGQRAAILNEPLLPWVTDNRTSLRFLWPELLVPAPMIQQKKQGGQRTLSAEDFSDLDRAAYIGPPGIGKTTALRRVALELTSRYLRFESRNFPVLLHARDYAVWFHADSPRIDRLRLPANAQPTVLIDGLDEVGQAARQSIIDDAVDRMAVSHRMIIGCRSDAFAEIEVEGHLASAFDEIFELQPWKYDLHVLPFVESYFTKIGNQSASSKLSSACERFPNLKEFVSNPFHLSLTIYLIQTDRTLTDDLFVNRYTLYNEFYTHWLTRERRRGTSNVRSRQIEAAHLDIARQLYQARIEGRPTPDLPNAHSHAALLSDTAFRGLFEWQFDPFEERDLISNFRHETLQEFLLARGMLRDFVEGNAVAEAMATQYNNDVNSFVRQAVANLPLKARKTIAGQLAVLLEPTEVPPPIAVREQAIYYLGRLALDKCPDILVQLAYSDPDPVVQRSATLGAILYGHQEIEEKYIARLMEDEAADRLNRSIQLVYFGDAQGTFFDFADDDQCAWVHTKAAIMERLTGRSERDLRLRLWDLATLFSFLRSRPLDALTPLELAIVRGSLAETLLGVSGRAERSTTLVKGIVALSAARQRHR
jgi:hypothetical protein